MLNFYFFAFLIASASLNAQIATFSSQIYTTVEVGQSYTFTANLSVLASNQSVIEWQWLVTDLGVGGTINNTTTSNPNGAFEITVPSTSISNTANITWQHQSRRVTRVQGKAIIRRTEIINGVTNTFDAPYYIDQYISVLDVCPPSIVGTTSVQQCCTTPLIYTVNNPCDADDFIWTIPSGWTLQSGQNTSTISVIPPYANTAANNVISCRVFRRASPVQPNELGSVNVTRYYPTHNITAIPNAISNVCPNEVHTYSVNQNCGVSSYNWTVPTGWTVASGQNTGSITATAGTNAQSGNVNVAVNYSAGVCNASDVQPVDVITAAPLPFLVQNNVIDFDYIYFHCNRWWFCANNSHNYMTGKAYPETESVNWKISAPWFFRLPNGGTSRNITWNVNYTQIMSILSPAIGCTNNGVGTSGGGFVTVTVGNCVGSVQTVQAFNRELSTFCQGNASCYPYNCVCCSSNSGCSQNPLRPDVAPQGNFGINDDLVENEVDFNNPGSVDTETKLDIDTEVKIWSNELVEIYPNPNTGIFYIQGKESIEQVRIFDTQGRLIYENNTASMQYEINLNKAENGIYWVQTIAKNNLKTIKILINR
jgi:PKD-like domain/Secretion system C-terminal sorting domain